MYLYFALGFFCGMMALYVYALFITHRQRKRQQEAIKDFQAAASAFQVILNTLSERHNLYALLKAAEDREDYEEAARLRDLINKR